MAEGFEEVYHVPQQSRRDKLRVGIIGNNPTSSSTSSSSTTTTTATLPRSSNNNNYNNNNFHIAPTAGLLPLYHHNPPSSDFDFQLPHNSNSSDLINYPFSPPVQLQLPHDQHLSLDLNLQQRYGHSHGHGASPPLFSPHDHDSALYSASLLKASKFFHPAHLLLHDLFHHHTLPAPARSPRLDPLLHTLPTHQHDPIASAHDGPQTRTHKSRLITMLEEVYKRYKLYYEQMQAVVTTFEYAAGLGNAAPYVNLAVKAMFKHFRFLKNAIADQLQFNTKRQIQQPYNPYSQRSIHNDNAGFLDHQPVWRPQRGLPESAVTVLRAWLFEHFLHPYPTDTDKLMLANQTGLSRSQVSNWFINARVRLWKPMVEEIHMLETRQAQKSQQREGNNNGNGLNTNDHLSSTNESLKGEHNNNNNNNNNGSSSNHDHHPLDLSNSNFFPTHPPHAAAGVATMGGGNVSLTLGLHQNHGGITLTEPFPINAAQHFNLGLEANGEGFVNEWF